MDTFDITYQENYLKMFRLANKMVNDEDVAKDILQEVFINYYEKSKKEHHIDHCTAWLMRAVVNKCIDFIKYQAKFSKIDTLDSILDDEASSQEHDIYYLRLALSQLKPREKTLAVLYSEGHSYQEISQITGIKMSSVGKLLSRSLDQLKEQLKKLNYEMCE
ncbi:MAG: sigma-70 family RNA polymerase sigma factor [Bacteroidales bacterium]|nr:sigma-70 family RNA polymerase sigma factor [Bacteroidales bacterium]